MESNFYNIFLSIALILFLIRFIYWKVTEVKADREKPRKEKGYSPKRMFTISIGILFFIQLIGVEILPFTPNIFIEFTGFILVVLGFVISMEGRRILGTNWAHAAEYQIKKGHELITGSIYRYMRHPIYSGYFLSVVGLELILSSYLCLIFVILAIPIMNRQAENEEKILTGHFGQKYSNYKKRTSRFIPYLW